MASAMKHENGYLLGIFVKNKNEILLSASSFVVMRSFGKQRDRVRQSLVLSTNQYFIFFAHKDMVVRFPVNCLEPNRENRESY